MLLMTLIIAVLQCYYFITVSFMHDGGHILCFEACKTCKVFLKFKCSSAQIRRQLTTKRNVAEVSHTQMSRWQQRRLECAYKGYDTIESDAAAINEINGTRNKHARGRSDAPAGLQVMCFSSCPYCGICFRRELLSNTRSAGEDSSTMLWFKPAAGSSAGSVSLA
jgi:hypothetical protein